MPMLRPLIPLLSLLLIVLPARGVQEDDDDWKLLGGALALLQQLVHVAATSKDPEAARKQVDAIVAGKSTEANRLAARMMDDMMEDMPQEQRATMSAIAQDLLTIARREQSSTTATGAATAPAASPEAALRARKELYAMGLRYWDEQQFLEAVRRGDRIAVDLFLAAGGLESRNRPPAR